MIINGNLGMWYFWLINVRILVHKMIQINISNIRDGNGTQARFIDPIQVDISWRILDQRIKT